MIALLTGAGLLFLIGCSGGVTHVDPPLGPTVVVSPQLLDLDSVAVGSHNELAFQISNQGGRTVSVLAVDVQNGAGDVFTFTGDLASEELHQLRTGDEADLPFAYDSPREGWHWANITVWTDGDDDQHRVDVRAQAVLPVDTGDTGGVVDTAPPSCHVEEPFGGSADAR